EGVEVGERQRAPHARERRTARVGAAAFLKKLAHRRVFVDVDIGRYSRGVALQPDPVHTPSVARRRSYTQSASIRPLVLIRRVVQRPTTKRREAGAEDRAGVDEVRI